MGQRGPAPAPINLKIIKGLREGVDSGGKPLPVLPPLERYAPEPPEEVRGDEYASEAWAVWAEHLEKADVLRPIDFAALSMACMAYGHFRRIEMEMQRQIKAKGTEAYLSPTRDGTPTLNPLWRARDQAETSLRKSMRECGLTPSSEYVLGQHPDKTPPDPDQNPFA